MVLQKNVLFSGTIIDNLRWGNPNATEEQIWDAIRAVSAQDVIAHLEQGLDTDVGEGGDLLSTGEKQLISFARIILKNPAVIILDEATSSIDTETETLIKEALDVIIQDKTAFIVAHRLSTIRNADRILYIANKGIAEQGTHAELMEKKGLYYALNV